MLGPLCKPLLVMELPNKRLLLLFFSALELVPKSRKKLIGALSCMHKGPKCIQTLWDYPKKIPFVEKYKE